MGFGGLYVGYFVVYVKYVCQLFGWLVGVFVDSDGMLVYWLVLQICE